MKCSIDLYINGNKVDIVNSEQFAAQFALTYSFSDLYEPDKITDSYSKSITLPGTPNNNRIFGNIWKLDSNNISVFNPSQLSDFQIFLNGELWQSGTVQLQEIARDNNTYTYKVVLYGSITRVMSMLLNSDIDDESNKLLRSLKFPAKLRHILFPTMLYRMWNSNYYTGQIYLNDYMQYVPCQNGLYDNFDSSKMLTIAYPWLTGTTPGQDINSPYYTCTPVVYSETNAASVQGSSSDTKGNYCITVASSGDQEFDEYSLRQWRIEYQRPAIKMNKLIEQIITDASIDASINLDSDFFNSNNPYWYNTYLTLSQYTTDEDGVDVFGTVDNNAYLYVPTNQSYTELILRFTQAEDGSYQIWQPDSSTLVSYGVLPAGRKVISLELMIKTMAMSPNKAYEEDSSHPGYFINGTYNNSMLNRYFNVDYYTPSDTWNIYARAYGGAYSQISTPYTNGSYDASIHSGIYPVLSGPPTSLYGINPYHYDGINYNYPNNKYQYAVRNNDISAVWISYIPIDDSNKLWKPFKINIDVSNLNDDGTITLNISDINHNFVQITPTEEDRPHDITVWRPYATANVTLPVMLAVKGITQVPAGTSNLNGYFPYSYGYTGKSAQLNYMKSIRSGDATGVYSGITPSAVTTDDMFDTTTTQGDILLNYTKLLGLLYVSNPDGSIIIMSKNKFFNDYNIIDWSDKVDYSKEMNIKPIPFNTRYLEMKYASGDSYYEKKYSGEFGLEYGEKKINTGLAFNSQATQLLDTIFTNTVMATEPRDAYSTEFRYIGKKTPNNYYGFVKKTWSIDPTVYPCYFDKDGNKKNGIDVKYSLLFDLGKTYNPGHITIDSNIMLVDDTSTNGGQFCWVHCVTGTGVPAFEQLFTHTDYTHLFSTHYDDYSWEIGYPRISYSGDTADSYPSGSTVYSRFWDTYISEIYNVRNKILTCYVKLSWIEILNFSFKNFVTINGVLYHPNKLLNVNPLSDDPVQVELIQVQNIAAYTEGQIIPGGTAAPEATIRRLRRRDLFETEEPEE